MKKTDLYKNQGLRIENQLKGAPTSGRYGSESSNPNDRRERRKLDQAQGLIPFPIKLHTDLVAQIKALAQTRSIEVNALVDELLKKGLAN